VPAPCVAWRAVQSCLQQGGEVPSHSFLPRILLLSGNNERGMCREGNQFLIYGCVRGSVGDGRLPRARTEIVTASARAVNSHKRLLVQLAGRKNKGNDARHAK